MKQIDVIVLGLGGVGRAVVKQIQAARSLHANRFNISFNFVALCDSDSIVAHPISKGSITPLADDAIATALAIKTGPAGARSLSKHPLSLSWRAEEKGSASNPAAELPLFAVNTFLNSEAAKGRRGIVVDCSATDATVPALLSAIVHEKNGVVMANKKPLTSQQGAYDVLTAPDNISRLGAESTVGAGTPMVAVLNRLVASGDKVKRIQGTFSGTLGFLMTGLEAGRPYADVVKEAFDLGYTEPDPRDDLGGTDVGRKALILARGLGLKLDLQQVVIEPLYPPRLSSVSVSEFMAALPELNDEFTARNEAAKSAGKVLRYVADVDVGKGICKVGLQALDKNTPLGLLSGTQNMAEYYTEIYGAKPLVVQGAGAGPEITAAGVIGDMIQISSALRL